MMLCLPGLSSVYSQDNSVAHLDSAVIYDRIVNSAEELINSAEYDSARQILQKARSYYSRSENHQKIIEVLVHSAQCSQELGDFDRALALTDTALILAPGTISPRSKLVADVNYRRGTILRMQHRIDDARATIEHALSIYESLEEPDPIARAQCYNQLAIQHKTMGDLDAALIRYKQALEIYRRENGENDASVGIVYHNIGNVFMQKGDSPRSLEFLKKGLAIHLSIYEASHPTVGTSYHGIGSAYLLQTDFEQSLEYTLKALRIQSEALGADHPKLISVHNNLGAAYVKLNKHQQARDHFNRMIELVQNRFGENHYYIGVAKSNLAESYYAEGDFEKARELHANAHEIYAQFFGPEHYLVARELYGMSLAESELENYSAALEIQNQAIAIQEAVMDSTAEDLIKSYVNRAHILSIMGERIAAFGEVDRALVRNWSGFGAEFEKMPALADIAAPMSFVESLILKSEFLDSDASSPKVWEEQVRLANLTIHVITEIRHGYRTESSKLRLGEYGEVACAFGVKAAVALHRQTGDNSHFETAFRFAEHSQANVLHDALDEAYARKFSHLPHEMQVLERDLRVQLAYLEDRMASEDDSIRDEYFSTKRQYEALIEQFERSYPGYHALKYRARVDQLFDIQSRLATDEAIVEYLLTPEDMYIFLVKHNEFELKTMPISADFSESVRSYLDVIRRVEFAQFPAESYLLYQQLIAPIRSKLTGVKRLGIIPHGILHSLPFETLLTNSETGLNFAEFDYLVNDYEIKYHFSGTLYSTKGLPTRRATPPSLVGFAPVFYGEEQAGYVLTSGVENLAMRSVRIGDQNYPALPGSEEELRAILSIMQENGIEGSGYFHERANELAVKNEDLGSYRYVHFATHTVLDEDVPRRSGLILAQPTSEAAGEDGILYAGEVYGLSLNAELVTLSSCESGVGKFIRGEGVMAMTRGFLYAGARNILYSLWKVPDQHTSDLMVSFYGELLANEKLSLSSALRRAKMEMVADPKTAFPRNWAGFVLLGAR